MSGELQKIKKTIERVKERNMIRQSISRVKIYKQTELTDEEKQNGILYFIIPNVRDTEGDLISTDTMIFDYFAESGSITLFHTGERFPVALPLKIERHMGIGAVVKVQYDLKSEEGKEAHRQAVEGYMDGFSIEATIDPDQTIIVIDEMDAEGFPIKRTIDGVVLLVVSQVFRQANQNARVINNNRKKAEVINIT